MRVEAIQPVLSSRGPGRGSGAAARVHVKVRWRFRGRVGFRDAVRAKVVPAWAFRGEVADGVRGYLESRSHIGLPAGLRGLGPLEDGWSERGVQDS